MTGTTTRQQERDQRLLAGTVTEVNALRSMLGVRGRPLKTLKAGDATQHPVTKALLGRLNVGDLLQSAGTIKIGESAIKIPHIQRFIAGVSNGRFPALSGIAA